MSQLPIDAVRDRLEAAMQRGPVVLTSPTGSGKSTQVPRWCEGRVLVVEPRRVACKTLAARVAHLEGVELGAEVGYAVRDDNRRSGKTRVTFMTPGIALRTFDEVLAHDVVIVDELHERAMDVDLIVALLHARFEGQLVVMSATLEADRVAAYLGGEHVRAEGRTFPVETRYLGGPLLPDAKGLEGRVVRAVEEVRGVPGDILVFLPGKGEIAGVEAALRGKDVDVVPLHGGLSLTQQGRAFEPGHGRKVVLSTNVAETSVTVPGIGVVIDAGLVRRTRYHGGRGFLTLMPIAADSAEQRAGRAGRTGPGVCVRLWQEAASLRATTPPEIRRESLLRLVLAAAACGASLEELSFLDPPKPYAVEAAHEEARSLGALAGTTITETGEALFGLPLDPPLGRLLVEARARGTLADCIDLVAMLAVGRPVFDGTPPGEDDCDATAFVRALRGVETYRQAARDDTVAAARTIAKRLRRAFGVKGEADAFDRAAVAATALAADPRSAHVARPHGRRVGWSNGGTEIELSRRSAAQRSTREEALVVYETRALGIDARKTTVVATCASPIRYDALLDAGLGTERVARVKLEDGRVVAEVERVFAKRVLKKESRTPEGALAREAIVDLMLAGKLFADEVATTRRRLGERALVERLIERGDLQPVTEVHASQELRTFLEERLVELGLEDPDDLMLLSGEDVLADDLPFDQRAALDEHYPAVVSTPEAKFAVKLDLEESEVTLKFLEGNPSRRISLRSIPPFAGFRVVRVDAGRDLYVLRR